MNLIRYQAPELASNRWSTLRDELDSFFELPFWSSFPRAGQLFTGWSPAVDLYQNADNIVAVVELPNKPLRITEGIFMASVEGGAENVNLTDVSSISPRCLRLVLSLAVVR